MGNTGYFERRVDYNEQAHEAATKLECPLFLINAPTVLWKTAGTVEQLMAENPALANSIRMSNTCDIYLLGVGSMGNDDIYVKSGMIEEEDIQAMMKDGAVGNLCSTFFRQDGSICNTDFEDRIVGVRIQEITKAQYSILMAAGSHKVNAIIGVLRGGFVNTLITDSSTAEAVIQMELE
jgi:deoxyribonucleoside regulator